MVSQNGKIIGPFTVAEDMAFHGMITDRAKVLSGVTFSLHGTVTGDLDVEAGATAIVHGTVNGTVRNHGGYVEIWGMVDRTADLSPNARTVIKPDAIVKSA